MKWFWHLVWQVPAFLAFFVLLPGTCLTALFLVTGPAWLAEALESFLHGATTFFVWYAAAVLLLCVVVWLLLWLQHVLHQSGLRR